jgi:KDO2-lipid IV(A) lauroyltransferase
VPRVSRPEPGLVKPLAARDARTGLDWTRRQRLKNDVVYLLVRVLLALADRLPPRLLLGLGRVAGRAAHDLLPALRTEAHHNLRLALPRCDARHLARLSFQQAGENLALTVLLRRRSPAALQLVDIPSESEATLRGALGQGRGVVFVSAHLGPFELIPAALAELGYAPAVVVRESYDRRLDPLVDLHRTGRGVQVIHRGRSGAALSVLRALRAGRPVGLLPDLGGRVASVPSRLLGQRVSMPVGPQRIARQAGCPVIVGTLAPLPAPRRPAALPRFTLRITRLTERDERRLGRQIADALSQHIRACPTHWWWMAPRFR